MSFRAEISISGFTYLQLTSNGFRDRNPSKAELLFPKNGPGFDFHFADLRFHLDDLLRPDGEIFGDTEIASDGSTVVRRSIFEKKVGITVDADPGDDQFLADWDGSDANSRGSKTLGPLDLLPRLVEDMGIQPVPPSGIFQNGHRYIAKVDLPPGRLYSRRTLLSSDGTPAAFTAEGGRTTFLADQIVWVRDNVNHLTIQFENGSRFVLDGQARANWGEDMVVRLAITNLPNFATSGRDWSPSDLSMFKLVHSNPNDNIRDFRRVQPIPHTVTPHSSCPPAVRESFG